jgi:hypothetical protein
MDEDRFETRSRMELRRSLRVLCKSSRYEGGRIDHSFPRGKIVLGIVVIAFLGCCVIGLIVNNKKTNAIQRPTPEQERIGALAEKLSSLTQTDLIVFPDGRVWYVRAIRGRNMEVVGWVGDNVRSENIDSFVLREGIITIVRHNDPDWRTQRDRFLEQ